MSGYCPECKARDRLHYLTRQHLDRELVLRETRRLSLYGTVTGMRRETELVQVTIPFLGCIKEDLSAL